MRIISTIFLILSIAAQFGCARNTQQDEYRGSMLSDLPFVYKMPVQQGNIVTKEMLDQLELGMTSAQVRYLLGTPMLTDMFHANRWDYTYTMKRGNAPLEKRPLTLFFEDDALVRIQGFVPVGRGEGIPGEDNPEIIVKVPDWEARRGLFGRALDAVGLDKRN
ncbi:outer membrane protein assembly factor BamE [Thiohalocapsa sp. ML1]|jgi:outer membrane protein assembly factor BamE|uniref:outer membrane protein assembly factor BamE n=1 Tax=Thiohalocapsa sp. ML1 TaxID=1431688 RepID=UPI000731EEC0|nr:outer membrane protein assembly factor BamE [Thiohalocapsa sp. ML1]